MKEIKQKWYKLLLCIFGVMAVIYIVIMLIDPFYHYHKPWFGIPIVLENAVYQTVGAARNLEYDSAIVGTSMTENFHTSWFDEELGWRTMKLSYSGARTSDLHVILDEIFEREEKTANIVMDINAYQLTEESWTAFTVRPDYLYDDNPLTDVKYIYNRDIWNAAVKRLLDKISGAADNIDIAYTWEDPSYFCRDNALEDSRKIRESLLGVTPEENAANAADWEEKLRICNENLRNIVPYIADNPETTFYIFYPPYSMLYWEQEVLKGNLGDMIRLYENSIRTFLQFGNVRLYYFQDKTDIISNLDNYRDSSHHKPEYNRYIFECIRDGREQLTVENYQERINNMYQIARQFDYDRLWVQ